MFILFLPKLSSTAYSTAPLDVGTLVVFILSDLPNIDVTGLIYDIIYVGIRRTCANGVTMRSSACLNPKMFNVNFYYQWFHSLIGSLI